MNDFPLTLIVILFLFIMTVSIGAKLFSVYKEKIRNFLIKIGIIPVYTEITLFLMVVSFVLIIVANLEEIESLFSPLLENTESLWGWLPVSILFLAGVFFSIYHAFSKRQKTIFEKALILFSVILINLVIGVSLLITLGRNIPALMNITVVALILIFAFDRKRIELIKGIPLFKIEKTEINQEFVERVISDKQTKRYEIIVGLIAVFIIFFISQYIFKNYWAVTFSICVFYASVLNEVICRIFFPPPIIRE